MSFREIELAIGEIVPPLLFLAVPCRPQLTMTCRPHLTTLLFSLSLFSLSPVPSHHQVVEFYHDPAMSRKEMSCNPEIGLADIPQCTAASRCAPNTRRPDRHEAAGSRQCFLWIFFLSRLSCFSCVSFLVFFRDLGGATPPSICLSASGACPSCVLLCARVFWRFRWFRTMADSRQPCR